MRRFALLALFAAPLAHAQSSFSLPGIPTSTAEASAARAATLPATGDPQEIVLNPAFLGAASGLRVSSAGSSAWLGIDSIVPWSIAVSHGAETQFAGQPLAVGVGAMIDEFRFEDIPTTTADPSDSTTLNETEEIAESAFGLGVGARWDGPVRVSAGAAAYVRQSPEQEDIDDVDRDRSTTLDLGALVEVPLLGRTIEVGEVGIPFSLVAGATHRNAVLSSDLPERQYEFFPGGDPQTYRGATAPTETVLGGGTRLAVVQQTASGAFTFGSLDSRVEREWVHYEGAEVDGIDRGGMRLAVELSLLETLVFRSGLFIADDGDVQAGRLGIGTSLRVDGLLRAIGTLADDARLRAVGERLVLRADYAAYQLSGNVFTTDPTHFFGFTLGWRP